MTDSDVRAVPAVQEWKPVPGFSGYEASHRGYVRSIDRDDALGRPRKGVVLAVRRSNRGRPLVNMVNDDGEKKTVLLYTPILLAHAGECPDGQEALHENDDCWDNRWPENLRWGTHEANVADRMRNRPAQPKPVKECARCGNEFEGNGRRCHSCVVQLGELGGAMLAERTDLEKVAEELGYPSAVGIWRLAMRYGGVVVVVQDELEEMQRQLREAAAAAQAQAPRRPWLHSVMTTLCGRRDSDHG